MNEITKSEKRLPSFSDIFEWPLKFDFGPLGFLGKPFTEGFEEVKDGYVLKVSLPSNVKDSLEVTVEDGNIKIGYSEKTENSLTEGSYVYSLPEDLDVSTIDASLKEGSLNITARKKDLAKKIDVKVK